MNTQKITVKKKDQTPIEIDATVLNHFAVHKQYDGKDHPETTMQDILETSYSITHIPTGAAICHGFDNYDQACASIALVYKTLNADQYSNLEITDFNTAGKNKVLKAIGKYLDKACKVANNIPLERQIGVFYKDRADCEKLRIKINPKNNKLLDDNALLNPGTITDLMMGKLTI